MRALDILLALKAAIPDARPSLTLTEEIAPKVLVGICDLEGETRRFRSASLDVADLDRAPADVAGEIAAWVASERAKEAVSPPLDIARPLMTR